MQTVSFKTCKYDIGKKLIKIILLTPKKPKIHNSINPVRQENKILLEINSRKSSCDVHQKKIYKVSKSKIL